MLSPKAMDWNGATLSLFGDAKYPADFKHFDYVNSERAEGRRRAADRDIGTFDNFNRSVAGVKGRSARGLGLHSTTR